MHTYRWNRMLSGIVILLAALMLIACASGDTDAQITGTQATDPPQGVTGSFGDAVGQPEDRLADGIYSAAICNNLKTDDSGRTWATVDVLIYEEIPDSEIKKVRVSDSIRLGSDSFVVRTVELVEEDGVRKILFNNGTEYCVYIPGTKSWRFMQPNGEPYLRAGGQYVMPIAVDATFTDERTPLAEGWNVYGMPDDGDPTIGMLDELADYFRHYPGMEREDAIITVRDGEIADVLIEYHP